MNIDDIIKHPNRAYIQSTVGNILANAISEAHQKQPDDVVEFIAMYLKNFNQTFKNNESYLKDKQILSKMQFEEKQAIFKQKEQHQSFVQKKNDFIKDRDSAMDKLADNPDFNDLISDLCNHLVKYNNVSTAYITKMSKDVKTSEPADSLSENLFGETNTLRIIAINKQDEDMLKTFHDINSVTGQLLAGEKLEEEVKEGEEEENNANVRKIYFDDEHPDVEKVLTQEDTENNYADTFIPEVIANDSVKFWRVPRLGSLYCLKFLTRTCLHNKAIDDAIADHKHVQEKKSHQAEVMQKFKESLKEWEENENGDKPEQPSFDPIINAEPTYESNTYCLVVDNLGQEKLMLKRQREYVLKCVKQMRNALEEKQRQSLKVIVKMATANKDSLQKEFESEYNTFQSEWEKEHFVYVEEDRDVAVRFHAHREAMTQNQEFFKNTVGQLAKFDAMKYSNVVVVALYLFMRVKKEDIMLHDHIHGVSNQYEWNQVKKFINQEFYEKIKNYNPEGEKTEDYQPYHKLKYIENTLSGLETYALNEFALGLGLLKDLCLYTCKLRRLDRKYRITKREDEVQQIETLNKQKMEFEARKKTCLENNEEWTEGEFNQEVPEIPPVVTDNDIE